MTPTPILDPQEIPPQPSPKKWAGIAIGVVVGGLIGIFPTLYPRVFANFNGILFLLALYVAITLHEVGHLLAGKIVGMSPGAIIVGGFQVFKSGNRWLFRFDYRRMFFGGCAKVQPKKDHFRPSSFGFVIALSEKIGHLSKRGGRNGLI
jgi:hypothetical protein